MQLLIRHQVPNTLSLPINYNHILQALVFRHLSGSECTYQRIHDKGAEYDKRQYKLFVFSLIHGKYHIKGKNIIFEESVEYEIRSPDAKLVQILAKSIRENGLTYGETHFDDVELEIRDDEVESDEIMIRMISPVCVYSTDRDSGFTRYYSPKEADFERMIQENFYRKYQAYSGVKPVATIKIVPVNVSDRDKFITRYKSTYINGWNGSYILKGPRRYLDFLYQTGIGSKNSQGFGMFQMIK